MQDDEEYGFLESKTRKQWKTILGQFYSNDGNVIDQFKLHTLQGNSYQDRQ